MNKFYNSELNLERMSKPSSTNRTGGTTVPILTTAQSKPPNGTQKMTLADIKKEIELCKLSLA
jgi:hypothetical protein